MNTYQVQIRVRYKETDNMGVVHHSNYVNYYEVARTEMLRSRGTSYRQLEESGVMMPVKEVSMQYISPAHYDDLLTVKIEARLEGARMDFYHEIFNEEGVLVNTGRVVLVFVNKTTRRPCRPPKWFVDCLSEQ